MRPALSVIFFTVGSGAGLGLSVWLVLARWLGHVDAPGAFWRAAACAFVLVAAGFASSAMHLANRRNAWRAMARLRTSWLSREAAFALLFHGAAGTYLLAVWTGSERIAQVAGVAVIVLAACLVTATAMIYACLKTIPQWRTWHTVIGYPLFGLASGVLVGLALCAPAQTAGEAQAGVAATQATIAAGAGLVFDAWRALAVVLLAVGALVKSAYYVRFPLAGEPRERHAAAMAGALNLPDRQAHLFDAGHAHDTFVTREFCFRLAREKARLLRGVVLGAGFVVPALLLAFAGRVPAADALAALCCLAGLGAERWLYFAEARHVVRRYHGLDAA